MTARKKATRKKTGRKKAPRKATRKKAPRKKQARRAKAPGSTRAARGRADSSDGRGKPPIQWDLPNLERLAAMGCTQDEAAYLLDVSRSAFKGALAEDEAVNLAWRRGEATGKKELRSAQHTAAVAGDRTMLVWLGKCRLGQRETVQVGNPDGTNFDEVGAALARKLDQFIRSRAQAAAGAAAEES